MVRLFKNFFHNVARFVWISKNVANWPQVVTAILRAKFSGSLELVTFIDPNGVRIITRTGKGSTDDTTVKEVFYSDCYRVSSTDSLRTVVDVGANIGVFCLKVLSEFPQAKITAFEPDEENRQLLTENLRLNGWSGQVKLSEKPVTGKGQKVTFFHSNTSTAGHSIFEGKFKLKGEKGRKAVIGSVSLEAVLGGLAVKTVDLLKVDCEGAEYEIFRQTSSAALKRVRFIRLEYHDGITTGNHQDIIKKLEGCGFWVESRQDMTSRRWTRGMIFAVNRSLVKSS